jgi:hypothetical protein
LEMIIDNFEHLYVVLNSRHNVKHFNVD